MNKEFLKVALKSRPKTEDPNDISISRLSDVKLTPLGMSRQRSFKEKREKDMQEEMAR